MSKVTFQCIRSGNFVSFVNEDDIAGLRKHEGYKEVKNAQTTQTIEIEPQQATFKEAMKRGRPAKIPAFLEG